MTNKLQDKSMIKPPCCGIIVFDHHKTILVSTQHGNFSFPKGKRKKNESNLDVAWRELEEETGLTDEHVGLIENFCIDEYSNKNNISIRYYVGFLLASSQKINI